jgi:hypothetical protein
MHVGRRLVYTHRKYDVTFNDPPDLTDFPFDFQSLKIVMQLKSKAFADRGLKMLPMEFQKVDPLPEWEMLVPTMEQKQCVEANPIAVISIHMKRKPGFYVRVGIMMLGLLTTISFASNSMNLSETPDRIQSVLASIFTVLSLRFSLNDNMATVNYMTALDVYNSVCMGLLAWLLFFHAGISGMTQRLMSEDEFEEEAEGGKLDRIELIIWLITLLLWIIFNVGFGLVYTLFAQKHILIEDDVGYIPTVSEHQSISWFHEWEGQAGLYLHHELPAHLRGTSFIASNLLRAVGRAKRRITANNTVGEVNIDPFEVFKQDAAMHRPAISSGGGTSPTLGIGTKKENHLPMATEAIPTDDLSMQQAIATVAELASPPEQSIGLKISRMESFRKAIAMSSIPKKNLKMDGVVLHSTQAARRAARAAIESGAITAETVVGKIRRHSTTLLPDHSFSMNAVLDALNQPYADVEGEYLAVDGTPPDANNKAQSEAEVAEQFAVATISTEIEESGLSAADWYALEALHESWANSPEKEDEEALPRRGRRNSVEDYTAEELETELAVGSAMRPHNVYHNSPATSNDGAEPGWQESAPARRNLSTSLKEIQHQESDGIFVDNPHVAKWKKVRGGATTVL